jgi:hypothetical protein
MPLQATSGAASYDAFGGGAAAVPNYIEDVFSTYLYTGNGSTQTITNGIDLSGKGGLVWIKARSYVNSHDLMDTARGKYGLSSNSTSGQFSFPTFSFNSNGFTDDGRTNGGLIASWTFRKQPKFFDVVTFSTNASGGGTFTHNLGSTPGFIIVKSSSNADQWTIYHRSLGTSGYMYLNTTAANNPIAGFWSVSSTSVTFANGYGPASASMVAYVFAHNAGGFGLTGTDNVISCGTYTGNGSATGPTVTLGYEPQWVLVKRTDSTSSWTLSDNMRGQPVDGATAILFPNLSDAEASATTAVSPTATGFQVKTSGATYNASGGTYIYIAIRRGPMKVPTSGTSVFAPVAVASSTSNGTQIANSFVTDMAIGTWRDGVVEKGVNDRLRGISTTNPSGSGNPLLKTNTTGAETTPSNIIFQGNGNATMLGQYFAGQGYNQIYWLFGRAPSFFDEVCWTGNDAAPRNINHNLTVVPEMMIVKGRSNAGTSWIVYHKNLPSALYYLVLESTAAQATGSNVWRSTAPTASVFTVGNDSWVNTSGDTFVNYLFATAAGVSKVGSYTGTATTLQIDCGFTGGARFVLIKKTSGTGSWYVWDSARGIVSGNDPYLLLNSTAAEVTNTDYIDTYSAGFEISSTAPSEINENGGSFIFLAIA